MDDLQHRLDTYAALSRDERAAVDDHVREHPDWADELAEAQAFAALLDGTPSPQAEPDTTDLADYLASLQAGDAA
jgi:hypothetical protein